MRVYNLTVQSAFAIFKRALPWIIQHGEIALSAKSCGRAIANGESDEADLEYSHDDQCVFRWDGQVWEVERVD